jgi:phosphoglycolate phosphatase-like HAD superfamily hydrolase
VISHIVWDWNGTLFDDFAVIVEVTDRVLRERGFAGATVDDYRTRYCRPIREFYGRLAGRPLADAEWLAVDREFHDGYEERMRECTLAAGALDLLRDWPVSGAAPRTQSLLSMWHHHRLVEFTEELALTDRFVRIDGLTADAGSKKAESLLRHLGALRTAGLELETSEIALIGDSLDDAHAAAAVGAACVLHTGGIDGAATLAGAGVPIVDSLGAAVGLIASW